eukprot:CAMPEP_0113446410 /NCGR_PEP_ID=MMETSP0014_2-20120614/3691_1 /TAXON_ID=2857 /ORGANISM="Nitzschia sp." /LENGTH=873 /DNA_ID=CAMNT_0000337499 /DNA_START=329 /DNA_END=2950 /DNA_ORIENTATION=+ /assembly_acc=CAM_ASM_000159
MWNHQPSSNSSSSSSSSQPQQQQQQQQPQQQQRQKKKVEWSTTLSSSDEPPPPPPPQQQQQQFNNHPHHHQQQQQQQQHEENKSPGWDTESDHLLSYFLSSSNGGIASPNTDTQFVTTPPIPSSNGSVNGFGLVGGSGTSPLPVVVGHGGGGVPQRHQQQQQHQSQQQMMPPTAMRQSTYGKHPSQQPSSNSNPSLPSSSPGPLAGPPPTAAMLGFVSGRGGSHGHGGGGRRSTMMSDDDDDNVKEDDDGFIQPPPTPAVHHYYPSSSSSSRNKMKTTINSGQGVVPAAAAVGSGNSKSSTSLPNNANGQQHVKNMEGISPISPAAMIGPENHEPMVLPGQKNPPQPPAAAAAALSIRGVPAGGTGSATTQQHPAAVAELEARKSHMEWLKQINTLAQSSSGQAGTVGTAGVGQIQSAHLMPQQHHINQSAAATIKNPPSSLTTTAAATAGLTFGQSSVPFIPPGVPLHPAAAAVLASSSGNPMYFSHHAAAFLRQQASSSPVESEEKRAKRLERNRESARKSRRRKKERLQTLEKQVNGLHNKIEKSRRVQINAMDITLGQVGKGLLDDLLLHLNTEESLGDYDGLALRPSLTSLLEKMETPIRRDVVEFQYSTLGQYLCPRYQKFILWLFLHNETYFLKGKEEYQTREAQSTDNSGDTKSSSSTTSGEAGKGQQKAKAAAVTGKISSKQIGDEMTNGPKPENGTAKKKKALKRSDSTGGERLQLQAVAEDAGKMWPLTCFELSISVDQEEKVLLARKRVQNYEKFQHEGSQIAAASRMTSRLKEAVQYQLFVASYRKKKTFLDILTPRQAIKYQEWLLSNGDRCRQMLADDRMKVSPSPSPTPGDENVTLEDVCRNLEKVLKISKLEPSEM